MKRFKTSLLIPLLVYVGSYIAFRTTHTMRWFDKTTEEVGYYTAFDTCSAADMALYKLYYPVCCLDRFAFGRDFERDKS
jgi:hypothetical protein